MTAYEVVVEQMIVVGTRKKPDSVERRFTVQASNKREAAEAAIDAGIAEVGDILRVEEVTQ
jgi:hypothetical protein